MSIVIQSILRAALSGAVSEPIRIDLPPGTGIVTGIREAAEQNSLQFCEVRANQMFAHEVRDIRYAGEDGDAKIALFDPRRDLRITKPAIVVIQTDGADPAVVEQYARLEGQSDVTVVYVSAEKDGTEGYRSQGHYYFGGSNGGRL